jgi:predicted ATPase
MTAKMLDHITIRGFRSIAAIERFELRALNVLIGANGSGKSNFLEAFRFLREIREGRLQDYVGKQGDADSILHFGGEITPHLDFDLSFGGGTNEYGISLGLAADKRFYLRGEHVSLGSPRHPPHDVVNLTPRPGPEAGISDPEPARYKELIRTYLGAWTTYHFHDTSTHAPLRKTARIDDNRFLRSDGSNLAAFLYFLRERYSESYRLIQRTVQRIAPFFDDFQLEPRALQPDFIRLEWRHDGSDRYFDVSSFSDGTLRFIALATLLLQPPELRPSVILIDEPELGLHPAAITILGGLVRMASKDSQVILSTQSSLFLDEFEPQDILVAERVGMATQLTRLDPESLKVWLEDYSLGQLWEKNELGGRP